MDPITGLPKVDEPIDVFWHQGSAPWPSTFKPVNAVLYDTLFELFKRLENGAQFLCLRFPHFLNWLIFLFLNFSIFKQKHIIPLRTCPKQSKKRQAKTLLLENLHSAADVCSNVECRVLARTVFTILLEHRALARAVFTTLFMQIKLQAAASYRLKAASYRLQATGCRPEAAGHKLQAASCRLQATGCRLQAAGYRRQARSFKLQATSYTLQATGYRL